MWATIDGEMVTLFPALRIGWFRPFNIDATINSEESEIPLMLSSQTLMKMSLATILWTIVPLWIEFEQMHLRFSSWKGNSQGHWGEAATMTYFWKQLCLLGDEPIPCVLRIHWVKDIHLPVNYGRVKKSRTICRNYQVHLWRAQFDRQYDELLRILPPNISKQFRDLQKQIFSV